MKRLQIKNLGPIQEANIEIGQINVIIGLQSSGKSCVLKTACYCAWVEKRIELSQKINGFSKGRTFIDIMEKYHNMTGYVREDTYIKYETSHLWFSYDNSTQSFEMRWKSGHWNYKRTKVSYIPADRNLVAAIPGWGSLSLSDNMIEFMSNWDRARRYVKTEENFLDLGMSYMYDSMSNDDKIQLKNGKPLMLKESSSGIQSLLPMYVHLDYLTHGQYEDNNVKISYEQKEERKELLSILYHRLNDYKLQIGKNHIVRPETVTIEGFNFSFSNKETANRFQQSYFNYINTDHSEIFLEEPEDNLFPPTQCQFVNWLLEAIRAHNDLLFIATHSPYILNQLIKMSPKGLNVLFTHHTDKEQRMYSVRQLKENEVREIYDNGVDMFFNFELYV